MVKQENQFAVLGLGRFGTSIVKTLAEYDVNVLAVDISHSKVQNVSDIATYAVVCDISDEMSIKKLGIGNFDVVVLAVGEDFEVSIMATIFAKELGVKHLIVKARDKRQKKILLNVGADHVVLPEYEMGVKIARSMAGNNVFDIMEESDDYVVTEMYPQKNWIDKSISQVNIRQKHNLTILAIKRNRKLLFPISAQEILQENDILVTVSMDTK